jgi:hypothetical protein
MPIDSFRREGPRRRSVHVVGCGEAIVSGKRRPSKTEGGHSCRVGVTSRKSEQVDRAGDRGRPSSRYHVPKLDAHTARRQSARRLGKDVAERATDRPPRRRAGERPSLSRPARSPSRPRVSTGGMAHARRLRAHLAARATFPVTDRPCPPRAIIDGPRIVGATADLDGGFVPRDLSAGPWTRGRCAPVFLPRAFDRHTDLI